MLKKLVSFGHKYGTPEEGPSVVVIDVRSMFPNPHSDKRLKDKTGLDLPVIAYVSQSPNFSSLFKYLKEKITSPGIEVAYLGCYGGRHRSVALAKLLGEELGIEAVHRDLGK